MVADDMACNPRNPRPATVFNNQVCGNFTIVAEWLKLKPFFDLTIAYRITIERVEAKHIYWKNT